MVDLLDERAVATGSNSVIGSAQRHTDQSLTTDQPPRAENRGTILSRVGERRHGTGFHSAGVTTADSLPVSGNGVFRTQRAATGSDSRAVR